MKMEKKKFRFNLIDAVIIIAILAAIALLVYVFVISDKTQEKNPEFHYTCVVEVTRINKDAFGGDKGVKEGMAVYNPNSQKEVKVIGHVTKVLEESTKIPVFSEKERDEIYTELDGLVDLTITFEGTAEKTEWGYQSNELYLAVNDSIPLRIGDFRCNGTCIELKIDD